MFSDTDGPEFIDPNLPSPCNLIGTNGTYNCSAEWFVVGNPQPSLTANVTQSEMNLVEVAVDTVITKGSIMTPYSIAVMCVADNGVGPVVTAVGYLKFGSKDTRLASMPITTELEIQIMNWSAIN